MGYVSSTCTSLTPITNTNGQWSATDVSFQFHDPEGSFTMTHGSGSYGYQGLRTNAKYKYFRMSYEWYGTTGGYLGPFGEISHPHISVVEVDTPLVIKLFIILTRVVFLM